MQVSEQLPRGAITFHIRSSDEEDRSGVSDDHSDDDDVNECQKKDGCIKLTTEQMKDILSYYITEYNSFTGTFTI